MDKLTDLPNIGIVLAEKLTTIGIKSRHDLQTIGSIETVLRIGEKDLSTCYNMLYAIEGAIQGIRWHSLPNEERTILKNDFNNQFNKQ
jgi:DNA transformation protein and related proteins